MADGAQPCAPNRDPFERARELFLEQLSEEERIVYNEAEPENLFYRASVFHSSYQRASKLQTCRSALMPFIQVIKDYGELIAAPLSSASVISTFVAPIWGSLRVVIHIAQAVDEYFENLIEMLRQIGDTLPQFRDYHRLFPNHGRLTLALSEALASILTFCRKMKDHFKDNEAPKKWVTFGHRGSRKKIDLSVADYLDDFKKARQLIEKEAQISKMIEDKKHQDRQDEHDRREDERWALREGRSREKRLKEALSTLSRINYKSRRQQLQSERHIGTSEWLAREPSFESWLTEPSSGLFYCFGIPGSGKSILASTLIDQLTAEFSNLGDFLGFYFCDYQDPASLKCATMLGTLIRQLLDLSPRPEDLVAWILDNVDEEKPKPSPKDVTNALTDALKARERIFLILDGIDELDAEEQSAVQLFITSIMSLEKCAVKVLVSCRPGVNIDLDSHASTSLTISSDHVQGDVELYVKETVEEKLRTKRLKLRDATLKQEIIHALSIGAKELFLWVKFQIAELCACLTDAQIRETLQDLPKGLATTYARILRRISRSTGGSKRLEIARAAFRWIICAKRPLSIEELYEALALVETDTHLHRDRIMANDEEFIQACGHLVMIQVDGMVRLAHHTVQQFLLRSDQEKKSASLRYSDSESDSDVYIRQLSFEILVPTNAGFVISSDLQDIEHVRFFFEEGDRQLGQLCISYLHFKDFESQITVRNQRQIQVPAGLVNSISSGSYGLAGRVISQFQGHPASDTGVGNVALKIPALCNKHQGKSLVEDYKLLEYVRSFWPFHLENFTIDGDSERVDDIVSRRNYPFEACPWRTSKYLNSTPRIRDDETNSHMRHDRLVFYWALEHQVGFLHKLLEKKHDDLPLYGVLDDPWKNCLRRILKVEISQDTPAQSLFQITASWGPNQLSELFQMFYSCIGPSPLPVEILYQAFAIGSDEVRQLLYDTICGAFKSKIVQAMDRSRQISLENQKSASLEVGRFVGASVNLAKKPLGENPFESFPVAFDDWTGNDRLLGLGQLPPWSDRQWRDVSTDKERIMSQLFIKAFPEDLDVMIFIFPLLEDDTRNETVIEIIRRAKYPAKGSDDTKREMIITHLVDILSPTYRQQVSSIRMKPGMEKWIISWVAECARRDEGLRNAYLASFSRSPSIAQSASADSPRPRFRRVKK